MGSPFGPLTLLVDPRAGRGRVGKELPEVERTLLARGLDFRVVQGPPEEIRVRAGEALQAGDRFLVAVGDDRTVFEVVNGMIEDHRPVAPDAGLGVVPEGSGCDFARTVRVPGDAT